TVKLHLDCLTSVELPRLTRTRRRHTLRRGLIGKRMRKWRVAIAFALFMARNVSGQDLVPSAIASPAPEPAGATAEVERVIVTGSNIPTAEETGPNPLDTYRREDIEKLGVHNATDLLT